MFLVLTALTWLGPVRSGARIGARSGLRLALVLAAIAGGYGVLASADVSLALSTGVLSASISVVLAAVVLGSHVWATARRRRGGRSS